MKKKLLKSMRVLLVAAGLCVGASAWATVTPFSESYSSESTTTGWSTSSSGRITPVILNENDDYFMSVTQSERNNNGCTVTGNIISGKAAAGDDFTLTFDMRLSSSTNQANTEFIIKDAANSANILSLKETGTWATTWKINGTDTQVTLPNSNKGDSKNTIADVTWCSYKISRSGSLSYLTITNKSTDEVIFARATIDGSSATGGLGNIQFVTSRYFANFAIDNIVVREIQDGDVPAVTPVNYTIKYRNESDEKIADDIVTASYVGAEISASAAQAAPVYYNEQKYIYKSGNDAITLVAEENSNVITLVFREAASYSYTVNAVDADENVLKQLASTTGFEGDVLSFGYPTYVLKDGKLWNCGATNQSYKKSFTLDADNKVFTIEYVSTDIDNVVFYTEAEDVTGMTAYRGGNADARSSQAAIGYAAEDVIFTTLPAGKYKLTFVQYKSTSGDGTMTFKVGDYEFSQTTASSNWTSKTFDEFNLLSSEDVVLKAGGSNNQGVDFMYIVKTGEATTEVSATVTSAGWATLYTPYALDFSSLSESLAAYTATCSESTVTLTKVNNVPAGTGVVLKAAEGTYNIPVIASSETDKGHLLGSATETTAYNAYDGYTLYMLKMVGENAQFVPMTSGSLAAGKAYLKIASGNSSLARSLNVVFADETTGIKSVQSSGLTVNGYYYLSGQRVAQPTKGLYIVNGKKIIVK